jgi:hypothetical protein
MNKQTVEMINRLVNAGISQDDAWQLRRIAMTFSRWDELECGDGNDYGSWAIERDDDTEVPYMVHHHYMHGKGKDYTSRYRIADRERGAERRLVRILAKYPGFTGYHQTDPRGCSLYVLPPGVDKDNYTRGIAVYK